jgi:pre-mRNA-processing factor 40
MLLQAEQRDLRTRNLAVLKSVFDALSITPQTRWSAFSAALQQHPTFAADPLLAELDPVEIIDMYEDRLALAEKALETERVKDRLAAKRSARHAREAFKALLERHVEDGTLTWRSKWRACLPLWRETAEYRALLGKPGSSALDLFHDAIDDLTIALETKAKVVVGSLEAIGFKITLETDRAAFDGALAEANYQGDEKDREDLWALVRPRVSQLRRWGTASSSQMPH